MAKRGKKEPKGSTGMPEGFVRVTAERGDLCFVRPEEGLIIHGELIGRFRRRETDDQGKVQHYYQIKIDHSVEGIRYSRDEDGESKQTEETLEAGTIVNVDEKTALEVLKDHVESGNRVKAWIKYQRKVKLKGGRTFWEIDVGVLPMKGGRARVAEPEGEDIPF